MISSRCCHNPEEERGSVASRYKRLRQIHVVIGVEPVKVMLILQNNL